MNFSRISSSDDPVIAEANNDDDILQISDDDSQKTIKFGASNFNMDRNEQTYANIDLTFEDDDCFIVPET